MGSKWKPGQKARGWNPSRFKKTDRPGRNARPVRRDRDLGIVETWSPPLERR